MGSIMVCGAKILRKFARATFNLWPLSIGFGIYLANPNATASSTLIRQSLARSNMFSNSSLCPLMPFVMPPIAMCRSSTISSGGWPVRSCVGIDGMHRLSTIRSWILCVGQGRSVNVSRSRTGSCGKPGKPPCESIRFDKGTATRDLTSSPW